MSDNKDVDNKKNDADPELDDLLDSEFFKSNLIKCYTTFYY